MDQFIIIFIALVGGGESLKSNQHFEEPIHVQIWFGENEICNDMKIFEQISKEISGQVYENPKMNKREFWSAWDDGGISKLINGEDVYFKVWE